MARSRVVSSSSHPYHHGRNNSSFVWRKDQEVTRPHHDHDPFSMMMMKTKRKSKSPPSPIPTPTPTQSVIEKVCKFWASGNCVKGDRCRFLHSWCRGDEVSFLANLQGHKKAVTGIALPSSGAKLYSSSNDGTLRLWDCHTGQCSRVINLGSQVGSLINDGPWVFVGMPNHVKAWNTEKSNDAEFSLNGPVGQVNSLIVANGMLLAGTQSGQILAWKGSPDDTNPFQPVQSLTGHARAVVCLVFGGNRLFSASLDHTIKMWDLDTLQCVATLNGHSDAVTSLMYWENYLLSCSLDGTIKVWATTGEGKIEVTYTHDEGHGVLALNGITRPGKAESEPKHILFSSCNDNSVRVYVLPSFEEKGRLFARQEIRTIQKGPGGLLFTGDGTGLTTVWKMNA